jgi:ABC-type Mn2+/Zn2+ transport system ATPase subunit
MKAILEFDHAGLGYGKREVLADVNMVLEAGDFLGIVGPNGAGKTTLLRAMIGTLRPAAGEVRRAAGVRFAYVPQRQFIDEVFPLSVMEVTMMGRYTLLGPISRPSKRDRDLVMQCLGHVGIADLASRPYRELSGGQKQRTLIARALAAEPQVLILDEPTNDMDIAGEHAIMELIKSLHDQDKLTIVMVSHLLNVVVNYARKLALIDGGLRMVGPTADVLTSENLTDIYEAPVQIAQCGDRKVVLTGGRDA